LVLSHMNDLIFLMITSLFCIACISVFAYLSISSQQRTIDRLTDKLMARNYKEYAVMQPKQEEKPKRPEKERISYWDDAVGEEDELQ